MVSFPRKKGLDSLHLCKWPPSPKLESADPTIWAVLQRFTGPTNSETAPHSVATSGWKQNTSTRITSLCTRANCSHDNGVVYLNTANRRKFPPNFPLLCLGAASCSQRRQHQVPVEFFFFSSQSIYSRSFILPVPQNFFPRLGPFPRHILEPHHILFFILFLLAAAVLAPSTSKNLHFCVPLFWLRVRPCVSLTPIFSLELPSQEQHTATLRPPVFFLSVLAADFDT